MLEKYNNIYLFTIGLFWNRITIKWLKSLIYVSGIVCHVSIIVLISSKYELEITIDKAVLMFFGYRIDNSHGTLFKIFNSYL